MSDPMQEIRASFFIECDELLEALMDGLEDMSRGADDSETVNVVFRAVHSIKGGAGAFGLDQLVAFAHVFESALDAVRAGQLSLSEDILAVFFQGGDILSDLVRVSREDTLLAPESYATVQGRLEAMSASGETAPEPDPMADEGFIPMALDLDFGPADARIVTINFAPETELFQSGNEPLFLIRALRELGEVTVKGQIVEDANLDELDPDQPCMSWEILVETAMDISTIRDVFEFVDGLCTLEISEPDLSELIDEAHDLPETPTKPDPSLAPATEPTEVRASSTGSAPPSSQNSTVRVDLDRIDRLVNLVGELVINQSMLSQSVLEAGVSNNTSVATGLEELLQLTRDIQDSVMMIRAQPVKSLFQRMARIVREASADVGKTVRLETAGENTEIDKTVIERLSDPLTHMIRNSIDHGIEDAETRIAAGKEQTGKITLSASHRSGRVVIEITDDGGGINREKVRKIAESKGLIPPDQLLNDAETDALLFLPGFSTADQISNLSGRGVGMDVVRSSITALGGRISITSNPGQGTTLSISLPLTLAVLDGMVVRTESETLVVPLSAVSETLTLRHDDILGYGASANLLRVRDTIVPLVDLGAELGYRPAQTDFDGAIGLLIVLEDGSQTALVVDAIEDQRQVVIKGLQQSYGTIQGIAAATILGDGQIALILDPADLVKTSASTPCQTHDAQLEGVA